MTTPTRQQIIDRAKELWHTQAARNGNPAFDVSPEIEELREAGLLAVAQSELMRDNSRHEAENWKGYVEQTDNFETDCDVKTGVPFNVNDALASGFYLCGTRQLSGKTNLAKLLVSKLIGYGVTVYVVDPSLAWLSNSPIKQIITMSSLPRNLDARRTNTIFNVSRLGYAERFVFVKGLCKGLTASHLDGFPVCEMVVFEEAQTYLPNGCMRSRKYSDITDFVTVGGNYGLSFGAVTQFSASVDKAVVKLAQQRFFGLTTEDNDKKYVRSFIGKKWMDDLVSLRLGQFLYQNRATIQKFQCDRFSNVHEVKADSLTRNGHSYQYKYEYAMVV